MKRIITLMAALVAMMSQGYASIPTFQRCEQSKTPALFQSTNATSLNLDAVLQIPPGVQAPALKQFYALVFANRMPSEQDYHNMVAEYQQLVIYLTNQQLMYNQLIVSGDYVRAMQIVEQTGALIPMQCYYVSAIQWYDDQKSNQ